MKKMLYTLLMMLGLCASLSAATPDAKKHPIYTVDFSKSFIRASENIDDIKTGPGVYYSTLGNSWLLHYNGTSTLEVMFTKGGEVSGIAMLNVKHLASLVGGKTYSPINITINGKTFLNRYSPAKSEWVEDHFEITDYLVKGKNTVKIQLADDSLGNYCINKLSVEFKPKTGWW